MNTAPQSESVRKAQRRRRIAVALRQQGVPRKWVARLYGVSPAVIVFMEEKVVRDFWRAMRDENHQWERAQLP